MTTDPGAEGIDELRERFAALLADRTGVDWDSLPPMATAGRLFEAGVILSEIGVLALKAERDRYREALTSICEVGHDALLAGRRAADALTPKLAEGGG